MKKTAFYFILLLSLGYVTGCTPQHADRFYNYDDFSLNRIPLIKPIDVERLNSSEPWSIMLLPAMWVDFPDSQGRYYPYSRVHEPEKFAVKTGVIMAYSPYVDKKAAAYIQENFYHWFVMVPDKEITKGFQTEDEFREYIRSLGVQDPDWHTPDETFQQFRRTGCLEWIPDCE